MNVVIKVDEETKKRTIQLITSADIFIQENIVPAFNVKNIKINSIFLDGVVSFDIIFLPGEDCNTAIEKYCAAFSCLQT